MQRLKKTPEPMKVIKPEGNGRFLACYTKRRRSTTKAQSRAAGRSCFEAKFTATDRLTQDRVIDKQASYMDRHQRLGARCFVVAGFSTGEVYKIPWSDWQNMKTLFGRKYVKRNRSTKLQSEDSLEWNAVFAQLMTERSHYHE